MGLRRDCGPAPAVLFPGGGGCFRMAIPARDTWRRSHCAPGAVRCAQSTADAKQKSAASTNDVLLQRLKRKPVAPMEAVARNVVSYSPKLCRPIADEKRRSLESASPRALPYTPASPVAAQNNSPSRSPNKAFPFLLESERNTLDGMHKPLGLIVASAYVLATACQLSGWAPGLRASLPCTMLGPSTNKIPCEMEYKRWA